MLGMVLSYGLTLTECVFASISMFRTFRSMVKPEVKAATPPVTHGEGPHWDEDKQVLYYVDITKQTINKYDPKTKDWNQVHIGESANSLLILRL